MTQNTNQPINRGDLDRALTNFKSFFLGTVRTYIDRRIVQLRGDNDTLDAKLTNFRDGAAMEFSALDAKVDNIIAGLQTLNSSINSLSDKIDALDTKVTNFRNGAIDRFDTLDTEVALINNEIADLVIELNDHRNAVETE